ncbi:MAG: A24 family peptidase [Pseudomonadota bacterium]
MPSLAAIALMINGLLVGIVIGYVAARWRVPGAADVGEAPAGSAGGGADRGRVWQTVRSGFGVSPLVFMAAGAGVSAWTVMAAPLALWGLSALLGWLLLVLAAIDFRLFILPNRLVAVLAGLGALMVAFDRPEVWLDHAIGGALGYGILFAVEVGYKAVRGRDGLGRGDAKLLGAIGVWTGWEGLPSVMLAASVAGLGAALAMAAVRRTPLSGSVAIAFGPWIALGGWIVWLHGPLRLV